jgi:hypothetical protein
MVPLSAIEITPTGGSDDYSKIQNALNNLKSGDTIRLNGNFIFKKTIYIPSNIVWILKGKLTLSKSCSLDEVGYRASGIDSRRPTGITEKDGGASNIDMSGGTYEGNGVKCRLINFIKVSSSVFHDMTVMKCGDDNFTLAHVSSGNICRNIISQASVSGNAITDKGKNNKWYDCIAEECGSDGFTPKCIDCEFYRCIARNNDGPGFGLYCRLDGGDGDKGTNISGNKFYACEAYNNTHAGFSANISDNCGSGAIIRNNFIQGKYYNNGAQGVLFRCKTADGIVDNNVVDVIVYGNKSISSLTGTVNTLGGGISVDGENISGITGSAVAYDETGYDFNFASATGCAVTAYWPIDKAPPKISVKTQTVTIVPLSCPSSIQDAWCVQVYCGNNPIYPTGIQDFKPSTMHHRANQADFAGPSVLKRYFLLNGRELPSLASLPASVQPVFIIEATTGTSGLLTYRKLLAGSGRVAK